MPTLARARSGSAAPGASQGLRDCARGGVLDLREPRAVPARARLRPRGFRCLRARLRGGCSKGWDGRRAAISRILTANERCCKRIGQREAAGRFFCDLI